MNNRNNFTVTTTSTSQRKMQYRPTHTQTRPYRKTSAEQREPIHDLPSLSQSTSSLTASEVASPSSAQHTTRIMRGAQILRRQLQQQQQDLIDQEAARGNFPATGRKYKNASYISESENEDEDYNDFDPWGLARISRDEEKLYFPETGDASKWAHFSSDEDDDGERSYRSLSKPDSYLASPPKRNVYTSPDRRTNFSRSTKSTNSLSLASSAEADALDLLVSNLDAKAEEEQNIALFQKTKTNREQKETSATKQHRGEDFDPFLNIVSPSSVQYAKLQKDPAFQHATRAGILWQSLVSQHVKFPSKWWNGSRSPPMGIGERRLWQYIGRHRVGGDKLLNDMVSNRSSAGRILLHIVVTTDQAALDIAIGCFHPNARGIRNSPNSKPSLEDCRDIWLATRRRISEGLPIESLLGDGPTGESPLGPKRAVNNGNMRFVFGEKPPLHTLFCAEPFLLDLFQTQDHHYSMPPSLVLLQQFLKVV